METIETLFLFKNSNPFDVHELIEPRKKRRGMLAPKSSMDSRMKKESVKG